MRYSCGAASVLAIGVFGWSIAIAADSPSKPPLPVSADSTPSRLASPVRIEPLPQRMPPTSKLAWTLDEAVAQLRLQPHDAYLQYVSQQLAWQQGKLNETSHHVDEIAFAASKDLMWLPSVPSTSDLFSMFSSARRLQEKLQFDILRGGRPDEPPPPDTADDSGAAAAPTGPVNLDSLVGPELKSPAWGELLAGRSPDVGSLAKLVPHDQYLIEFRSPGKMLDLLAMGELWSEQLAQQAQDATSRDTGSRLRRQLALDGDARGRPFFDLIVDGVAITGSDLFFREGTDVTVLFSLKRPEPFKQRMDQALEQAARSRGDAVRASGKLGEVAYESVATPDRSVHVFSCYPRSNLHVRSNSLVGLKRVLAAIDGAKEVTRLGETDEFRYIRTLMPRGAAEEDGFVYFPEAFLKHLAGSRLRITERRRLLGYNLLRMIGHAAMLYRTQFGKAAKSLAELTASGCAPGVFGEKGLENPFHGEYSLDSEGWSGRCSVLGSGLDMTPCCELPLEEVTSVEAARYRELQLYYLVDSVNCFHPVPMRIRVGPDNCRLETIVPTFGNDEYAAFQKVWPAAKAMEMLPVPRGEVFGLLIGFDKQMILKGLNELRESPVAVPMAVPGPAPAPMPAAAPAPLPAEGPKATAGEEKTAKPSPEPAKAPIDPTTSAKISEPDEAAKGDESPAPQDAEKPAANVEEKIIDVVPIDPIAGLPTTTADFIKLLQLGASDEEWAARMPDFEKFFQKGLGDQIGIHVYDFPPLFEFNAGWFGTTGATHLEIAELEFGLLGIYALPAYFSCPVRDTAIVDEFLDRSDKLAAWLARGAINSASPVGYEFYRVRSQGALTGRRMFGFHLGAAKFRLYYERIGGGLYLATKQFILDDLIEATAAAEKARPVSTAKAAAPNMAHVVLRIRPEGWKQVLPDFRLGWAENNRQATIDNLIPLASVARAISACDAHAADDPAKFEAAVIRRAEAVHGTRLLCPEGKYRFEADRKTVTSTAFGSVELPQQSDASASDTALSKWVDHFGGAKLEVTFLPEGPRAVLTVERH